MSMSKAEAKAIEFHLNESAKAFENLLGGGMNWVLRDAIAAGDVDRIKYILREAVDKSGEHLLAIRAMVEVTLR